VVCWSKEAVGQTVGGREEEVGGRPSTLPKQGQIWHPELIVSIYSAEREGKVHRKQDKRKDNTAAS